MGQSIVFNVLSLVALLILIIISLPIVIDSSLFSGVDGTAKTLILIFSYGLIASLSLIGFYKFTWGART